MSAIIFLKTVLSITYDQKGSKLLISGNEKVQQQDLIKNTFYLSVYDVEILDQIPEIENFAFTLFENIVSLAIKSPVTRIGQSAFEYCYKLETVDLGISVLKIETNAFNNCFSLSSIKVPKCCTYIGRYAFYYTKESVPLYQDNDLETLDQYCFWNSSISEAFLPKVKIIEDSAFRESRIEKLIIGPNIQIIKMISETPKLVELSVNTASTVFYSIDNAIYNAARTALLHFAGGVRGTFIINGVTEISNGALMQKLIDRVEIGSTVTSIGYMAFYSCPNLKEVFFHEDSQLKTILELGFCGCSQLTTINLPLTSLTIGQGCFGGDWNLSIPLADTINYDYIDHHLFYKGTMDMLFFDNLVTGVIIPEGVKTIPNLFYYKNDKIRTVQFPSTLERVLESAFEHCRGITEVSFPKSIVTLDVYSFKNTSLKKITFPDQCQLLTVGWDVFECLNANTTEVIGMERCTQGISFSGNLFMDSNHITGFQFPSNTRLVGKTMFWNCKSVNEFTISAGAELHVQILLNVGYMPKLILGIMAISSNSFSSSIGLQKVQFLDTVEEIKANAFAHCYSLSEIIFGVDRTNPLIIGSLGFSYCRALKKANLPKMDNFVGNTFAHCNQLMEITVDSALFTTVNGSLYSVGKEKIIACPGGIEYITMGAETKFIESQSFYGCEKLCEVNFGKDLESISDQCFFECDLLKQVNIPTSTQTIGTEAFGSCKSLKIVLFCGLNDIPTIHGRQVFPEWTSVIVRYDYHGDTFVMHSIIKSNSIRDDHCPNVPSEIFSLRKGNKILRSQICVFSFLVMFRLQ